MGGTVCTSCQSGPAPSRLSSRPIPPLSSGAGRARCGGRCCCFLGPFCSARSDERLRARARGGAGRGKRRAFRIHKVRRAAAIAGEGGRRPLPGPCTMSWGTELWVSEGPGRGRPGREAHRGASACVVAQQRGSADRVAPAASGRRGAGSGLPERQPAGVPRGRGARAVPGCVIARAPGRSSRADLYAWRCGRIPRYSRGRGGLAGAGFRVSGVPVARGKVFSLKVRTLAPRRLERTCILETAQILNLRGAAVFGPQGDSGRGDHKIARRDDCRGPGSVLLPRGNETVSRGDNLARILRLGVQVG